LRRNQTETNTKTHSFILFHGLDFRRRSLSTQAILAHTVCSIRCTTSPYLRRYLNRPKRCSIGDVIVFPKLAPEAVFSFRFIVAVSCYSFPASLPVATVRRLPPSWFLLNHGTTFLLNLVCFAQNSAKIRLGHSFNICAHSLSTGTRCRDLQFVVSYSVICSYRCMPPGCARKGHLAAASAASFSQCETQSIWPNQLSATPPLILFIQLAHLAYLGSIHPAACVLAWLARSCSLFWVGTQLNSS
jgi:hypothetical protein